MFKDIIQKIIVERSEMFSQLAQGTLSAHRVYTCPHCGQVDAIHVFGEQPKCPACNELVTYIYEEDHI